MADLSYIAFGQRQPTGVAPDRNLPVILNSPQHHFALTQWGKCATNMDALLRSVGADAGGLRLSIVPVQRPPGERNVG